MAFTRVRGPGITTDDNYRVGIITATKFVGPMQASGDSDFTNISATGIGTIDGVKIGDPSGIVTASSSSGIVTYYGDASKLTGLTAGQIPNLAASKITSGTVATARLGSGTANSSTFLRGDGSWAANTSTTINSNTDNYLITGTGTADTLQGESSLTYDALELHVNNASPKLKLTDTDNSGIFHLKNVGGVGILTTSDAMIFETGNSTSPERLRIEASGRIGINTTSARVNGLHIYDKHFAVTEGYPITWLQPNSSTSRGRMTCDSGGNYLFQFGSGNDEKIRFKSDGKVGIGTDSPSFFTHIQSDGVTNDVLKITARGSGQMVNIRNHSNVASIVRFSNYLGNAFWDAQYNTDNSFALDYNDSEKFRIDSGGRVGIKNLSPSSQYFNNLVVGDNNAGDWGITIRTNSSNKGVLAFSDSDAADANRYDGYIAYHHNGQTMRFHTGGANERLRIDSTGRLLLGTQKTYSDATWYDDITINNSDGSGQSGGTGINLISSANSWGSILFGDNNDNNIGAIKYDHNTNSMRFVVNTIDPALFIDSNGDLGVNISNPTAKIHGQDDSATETNILKLRNYKSGVNTKPTLMFEAVTSAGQGANSSIQGLAGTDAGGADNANESGMKFIVRHGGSGTVREAFSIKKDGNIHFPSGQGISFAATADAANNADVAELLDDYEEGRHVVTVTGSSSNPTVNLTMPNLWYVKVGSMVHLSGELRWTTSSHGSGTLRISLPFAAKNLGTGHYFQGTAQTWNIDWKANGTSADYLLSEVAGNTSYMFLRCASNDNLLENALQLGSNVIGSANSGYGIELTVSLTYRAE